MTLKGKLIWANVLMFVGIVPLLLTVIEMGGSDAFLMMGVVTCI
jgi:hypothetical protein